MHPLDNPVWASLCTRHSPLARREGAAARYPADIAPFVAVDPTAPDAATDLARLVAADEPVLMVGPAPALDARWTVATPVPIAQMVCWAPIPAVAGPAITELDARHLADVLALTALVYPHYFRPRTPQMGRYIGIYVDGVLAAMAGERMGFDGHQEISAVCTHPEHTGRGYAQRLVAELTNASFDAARIPFLHVAHENIRAKTLYQRMGYVHRTDIDLWSLRGPA
jgi:ribosomal protein S18 acetylase RimI-like enzyme